MPGLRDYLRGATAGAHAALERTQLMSAMADGSASPDAYAHYLLLQYRLHVPLEAALRPLREADWRARRLVKSDWLRADLQALGLDRPDAGPVADLADAALADDLPPDDAASSLGIEYVLEGSTLGLRVVRQRFSEVHPARGAAGRFLAGYGESTGAHWKEFVQRLEAAPPGQWAAAARAALATFELFDRIFAAAAAAPPDEARDE